VDAFREAFLISTIENQGERNQIEKGSTGVFPIELLIVVLHIGIIASIADSQPALIAPARLTSFRDIFDETVSVHKPLIMRRPVPTLAMGPRRPLR